MVVAGCVTRLLASPRLLLILKIRERVHEAERGLLAALDLEGDHRAAAGHLPLGERGLRMVGAAGIETRVTSVLLGEEVGDCRRRRAMRASTRSGSVSRPFSSTQALNGLSEGPVCL